MTRERRSISFATLALLLLFSVFGCNGQKDETPLAKQGVIDLSAWDAARDGPVALDGQWEFYWERLIAPEEFSSEVSAPPALNYLSLPGTWKGQVLEDRILPSCGQATFRLRLRPGPENSQLAVRIVSIHAAYRLWADGKLVAASGEVGSSPAEEKPHRSLVVSKFADQGAPFELVLQVSNHAFRRGGLLYPILLGQPEQLEQIHISIWSWGMFLGGSLLIMAVYHLVLYFMKRKEASNLYFSLGCLFLICYYFTSDTSDWLIYLFFKDVDTTFIAKFSLVSYIISSSVVYRFYRCLYPKEFYLFIQYVCDIRNFSFILVILTQSNIVIYHVLYWFALLTVLFAVYYCIMLAICLRRGRDGAIYLLLGYVCLSAAYLSEIYGHIFSFSVVNILPFGLLAFVLSQALAMAQRFANAFSAVETLSIDLRTEMDERTRLEREIVNISEEERRRLSHDLHDGLCQQLAGTRMRCAALVRRPLTGQGVVAEVSQIASLLNDSVSQAYDLSRGLWPVEHKPGEVGPSLNELARRVSRISGIDVQYIEDMACTPCLNEHLVQLYRIAQEAVANAVKHAKSEQIVITLACAKRRLTLCVSDNGIGGQAADPSTGGLGLRIMAYRARMIGAKLSIDFAEAGGTVVACSLSCTAGDTNEEHADG